MIVKNPLAVSTVQGILNNPFYTGKSKLEGKWVPGQHKAIIPEELFNQVQI